MPIIATWPPGQRDKAYFTKLGNNSKGFLMSKAYRWFSEEVFIAFWEG